MLDTKFWAKYFRVYDVLNLLIPYQELLRDICDELDIRKGEKILEAGCGTGNLALEIKKRGANVVGLDNCQEALDIYKEKDSTAELVLADLSQKLPFSDNYFDKIACNNTLYAFPKETQLIILKEFLRILKPGGKLVVNNPKKGWKPIKIYADGVKKEFKNQGVIKGLAKILRIVVPTLKIFYYNIFIQKESHYYFCEFDEQKEMFQTCGFSNVSPTKKSYSGQSLINSGYKP